MNSGVKNVYFFGVRNIEGQNHSGHPVGYKTWGALYIRVQIRYSEIPIIRTLRLSYNSSDFEIVHYF